jgi:hypothetical protein
MIAYRRDLFALNLLSIRPLPLNAILKFTVNLCGL